MPVEWVQALLNAPEQAVGTKSGPPFWAASYDKWPYFMQVVQPYLTENWGSLLEIASKWAKQEPGTAEAWFYLAAAEYASNDTQNAEMHMQKVLAINHQHSQAIYYLGLLAEKTGNHHLAMTDFAMPRTLDAATESPLKLDTEVPQVQQ